MPQKTCNWPFCERTIHPGMEFCKHHWWLLPPATRADIDGAKDFNMKLEAISSAKNWAKHYIQTINGGIDDDGIYDISQISFPQSCGRLKDDLTRYLDFVPECKIVSVNPKQYNALMEKVFSLVEADTFRRKIKGIRFQGAIVKPIEI